jgi:hypothetical protein
VLNIQINEPENAVKVVNFTARSLAGGKMPVNKRKISKNL